MRRRRSFRLAGEFDTATIEIQTRIEILAGQLNELGIPTPELGIDGLDDKQQWIDLLTRMEVRARYCDLDGAIRDANELLGIATI